MEGHWKFLGGGGVLKAKFLEEMYENKLGFARGGGCKTKNLPWGEYGYFLELHNNLTTIAIESLSMVFPTIAILLQ